MRFKTPRISEPLTTFTAAIGQAQHHQLFKTTITDRKIYSESNAMAPRQRLTSQHSHDELSSSSPTPTDSKPLVESYRHRTQHDQADVAKERHDLFNLVALVSFDYVYRNSDAVAFTSPMRTWHDSGFLTSVLLIFHAVLVLADFCCRSDCNQLGLCKNLERP